MSKTKNCYISIIFIIGLILVISIVGCNTDNLATTLNIASNLLNSDCYAEGALTETQYDDLPFWEKLLYSKNSCGLYVKQDADDIVNHWF